MTPKHNEKLWLAIREAGYNQRGFAKAVGINECVVSQVVTGQRNLPLSKQTIWAVFLNKKTDELFYNNSGT